MSLPPQIDMEGIREVYLLANTPAYLCKHLRTHESVHRMANTVPIAELEAFYGEPHGKSDRTIDEVSLAYAALVALGLKDYSEARPVLERLPTRGLNWANRVRKLLMSSAVPSQIVSTSMSPEFPPAFTIKSAHSSTKSTDTFQGPRIEQIE